MGYQYLSDIRRLVNNTLSSMDVPVEVKQQARDTIMDVLNEQDKVFKRESEEIERLTTRISLSKMIENEINNRVPAVLKARNFSF
jgi:ribose 5-phosphate isomerase